jgi:uncharacterized membrane protein YidH (DUF202 family)
MATQNGLKLDMRDEPDFRMKLIKYLVNASWIVGAIAVLSTFLSIPASKVFLNDYLKFNLPIGRNPLFTAISLSLIIATFLVSIIGAILNSTRNRRRNDHFYTSLTVISIISGVGIIVWLALV